MKCYTSYKYERVTRVLYWAVISITCRCRCDFFFFFFAEKGKSFKRCQYVFPTILQRLVGKRLQIIVVRESVRFSQNLPRSVRRVLRETVRFKLVLDVSKKVKKPTQNDYPWRRQWVITCNVSELRNNNT